MTVILGNDRIPYRWFVKWVGTWSPPERKARLLRVVWSSKGGPEEPEDGGYSASLSLNLRPRIAYCQREEHHLRVCFCGIELHWQRAYGGWIR